MAMIVDSREAAKVDSRRRKPAGKRYSIPS
jgi:hypothetical protein